MKKCILSSIKNVVNVIIFYEIKRIQNYIWWIILNSFLFLCELSLIAFSGKRYEVKISYANISFWGYIFSTDKTVDKLSMKIQYSIHIQLLDLKKFMLTKKPKYSKLILYWVITFYKCVIYKSRAFNLFWA